MLFERSSTTYAFSILSTDSLDARQLTSSENSKEDTVESMRSLLLCPCYQYQNEA
jgi:hypothetical protein